jgi:hypothetical protein
LKEYCHEKMVFVFIGRNSRDNLFRILFGIVWIGTSGSGDRDRRIV